MISIQYKNMMYEIEQEPFETLDDSYTRAWFIVKNYDNYPYDELYSLSLIMINKNKGMQY